MVKLGQSVQEIRRRPWSWLVLAPAAALLAAGPVRLEKIFSTTANPRISLSNLTGQVVVRGWDQQRVHVISNTASPGVEVDSETFPAAGPADKIHLNTHVLDTLLTGHQKSVDYQLDVPRGSSLEIRNPEGSVQIERLEGEASVESVGGSITVRDVSGHLSVSSIGGNIEIIRPAGRVEAYSINGDLDFESPLSPSVKGRTTSGRIIYKGDFVQGGDYSFTDYSGDMNILCPASASFELNAKTVKGKVDNSFSDFVRSRHPLPSSNSLLGTYHSGDATVQLTTFSGTIHIHPQQ